MMALTFEDMLLAFSTWVDSMGWVFVPELADADEIPVLIPLHFGFSTTVGWNFLCYDVPFLTVRERHESSTGTGPVLLILERIKN